MGRETGISWTDATWNPVRGCSRVSQGCVNCYAEVVAGRFCGPGQPYEGLAERRLKTLGEGDETSRIESRWTGDVRLIEKHLADPLRWQKPKRIFVNSMSDLFHEKLPFEVIAAVFGIMASAPRHTFQVLTKRPERAQEFMRWVMRDGRQAAHGICVDHAMTLTPWRPAGLEDFEWPAPLGGGEWPRPNVHLGVSVEDQATADERIPLLLDTPASVRFVSYEPALGPVNFGLLGTLPATMTGGAYEMVHQRLRWIIVGGESGPRARPFDVQWAWDTVHQCKEAEVACFVKQLGSRPFGQFWSASSLITGKGDDPDEWLPGLRVQEFPEVRS